MDMGLPCKSTYKFITIPAIYDRLPNGPLHGKGYLHQKAKATGDLELDYSIHIMIDFD